MSDLLDAASDYLRRGWRFFPMTADKKPYTPNGSRDATDDLAIVERWAKRWPDMQLAVLTGEPSGIVALDVDVKGGQSGVETLAERDIAFHPESPTDHTP